MRTRAQKAADRSQTHAAPGSNQASQGPVKLRGKPKRIGNGWAVELDFASYRFGKAGATVIVKAAPALEWTARLKAEISRGVWTTCTSPTPEQQSPSPAAPGITTTGGVLIVRPASSTKPPATSTNTAVCD